MESQGTTHTPWRLPALLGVATLALAGCMSTDYAYDDPYATYPSGQTVYTPGQPVYAPGQPGYGQPVYTQPGYATTAPGYSPTGYSPDDYVYYPNQEVYYSPFRRGYYYPTRRGWTARNDPPPNLDPRSPSVHVRLPGGPERHHEAMRRTYPGTWQQYGGNPYHR